MRNFSERMLYMKTLVLLASTQCSLSILPFHRIRKLVYALLPPKHSNGRYTEEDMVRLVLRASKKVPANCLSAALVCQAMMRQNNLPTSLHVGVALSPKDHSLEAHAWIESKGKVLLGDNGNMKSYRPILSEE